MERAATLVAPSPHPAAEPEGSRRVLDTPQRLSEILFGLIMALTFTTTLSVATAGHEDVREMLIGALGCNIAWGIIDAVFFILGALAERQRNFTLLRRVRAEAGADRARALITEALPPLVVSVMRPADLDHIGRQLAALPAPRLRLSPTWPDLKGAFAVFLIVALITLPVSLPFVFLQPAQLALRVSNGVALVLLFATGYMLGRWAGRPPIRVGLIMTFIGLALVAAAIALGG